MQRKTTDIHTREHCTLAHHTEGCTPGYWRNHINRWSLPGTLKASSAFVEAFDLGSNTWQTLFIDGKNGPKNVKMWEAVDNPNKYGPFPFHAVAALLNAIGGNNIPAGSTGIMNSRFEFACARLCAVCIRVCVLVCTLNLRVRASVQINWHVRARVQLN